jgi:guanine deaminase
MSPATLYRATIFHTPADAFREEQALECHADGALVVADGRIVECGAYERVRPRFTDADLVDWRGSYLLPGLVDAHVHFPQLRVIGGLGRSLLQWLDEVALPEEARMADAAYAKEVAAGFLRALVSHGTTTALVYGAHFAGATAALFEAAAASGLRIASGLVLSDRGLRPELLQTPDEAYRAATTLIERFHGRGRLLYAVTPRFALSTSSAMLEVCQTLLRENTGVRFQSHVNESVAEVRAVQSLFPWAEDYLAVYERYALGGRGAVLAHNVQTTEAELHRLAASGTSVAHCPGSNAALGSGIFPLQRHLDAGVQCALGTDVGGGVGFGVLREALHAYLLQRVHPDGATLDAARLLYLATLAGATALGLEDEIGDFRAGKSADFVRFRPPPHSVLAEVLARAERPTEVLAALITLAGSESVADVRVAGAAVHCPEGP